MSTAEPGTTPAAAADPARRLPQVRLQLLAQSVDALRATLLMVDGVCAWLLWRMGLPAWALAAWLLPMAGLQLWRWRLAHAAVCQPPAEPGPALDGISRLSMAQAVMLGVLELLCATRGGETETFMATTISLGFAAGTAGVVGWTTAFFSRWTLAVGGAMVAGWLWRGHTSDLLMAALSLGVMLLMNRQVRHQFAALRHMVELACDNEQLAASLRAERDRVQALSDSRTRFFAAASHDLRQPLHAMSLHASALSVLARRQGDAPMQRLADGMDQALQHSTRLLETLLDVSRLEAGEVQPRCTDLLLAPLLDGLVLESGPQAQQQGLRLVLDIAPAARDARCHSDPELLRRILGNLLGNALKFTASGEVRLTLAAAEPGTPSATATATATTATAWLLQVHDTGPGIAADEQSRVFDAFYQGTQSAHQRALGLGLGLSIVQRLAQLLGIGLGLHSVPGAGSCFSLRLPAAAGADVATSAAAAPSAAHNGDPAGSRSRPAPGPSSAG